LKPEAPLVGWAVDRTQLSAVSGGTSCILPWPNRYSAPRAVACFANVPQNAAIVNQFHGNYVQEGGRALKGACQWQVSRKKCQDMWLKSTGK